MLEAPLPRNEPERLAALFAYHILDTDAEQAFDDLTQLASRVCGTPIALVSLVDAERQWFKSKVGLDACETPRGVAFCSHAILDPETVFIVPDSFEDERFADNPLATGQPHVRFYAGAPLVTPAGLPLGTLCVIDHEPRELDEEQVETLRVLARQTVTQLELRRSCIELARVADERERANQDLRDFTSIAAHDLQEPLRKLVAFGSLLQTDLGHDLPARAADDLGFMIDATERMQRLIADLLELSRAGNKPLKRKRISLRDCAESALHALSERIDVVAAEVSIDELPEVDGDPTLVTQLFQNLIGNALKFVSDEPPRITVSCERVGDEMVIGVRDNGIGINPDHIDQIFAPFRRLHGREAYEGTGIGLAIVRKAVERHDGRIWVESRLGEGSHFRFVLPGSDVAPSCSHALAPASER